MGSPHNGFYRIGDLRYRLSRATERDWIARKGPDRPKAVRLYGLQGLILHPLHRLFVCNLSRLHRTILLHCLLRPGRPRNLQELFAVHLGHGHCSVFLRPTFYRTGRALPRCHFHLVLLCDCLRRALPVLDRRLHPERPHRYQYPLGLLLGGPGYASGLGVSEPLS